MLRSTTTSSHAGLTATEWGMILTALGAYQHHAAYRDLHNKVAMLAKAAGGVSQGAMSAALRASGAGCTAVMG